MVVSFDLKAQVCPSIPWRVPHSWADFDVQPENLDQLYRCASVDIHHSIAAIDSAEKGDEALLDWSRCVESAVDRSLQLQHAMDPIRHPTKCLPDFAKSE